ncbi:MAG: tryptophan synthase subunit alpha [Mycobacteriales bacterium]
MAGSGTSPLAAVFARSNEEGRGALVGYLPAGFPTVTAGIDAMLAMADGGCDLIEVGVPYTDPVIDGPTIQAAAHRALRAGVRTADVLHTVEALSAHGVPAVVMTYWNPIVRYGVDRFAGDLVAAGGAGIITPDLIPDEAAEWIAASDAHGLDRIFLIAPSSSDARIAATAAACRGFLYATSVMGVTGARDRTSDLAPALVAKARAHTGLPIGVGLGVKDADQAAAVASYADAVIVGSAFCQRILDAPDDHAGVAAAGQLAGELARGVRR